MKQIPQVFGSMVFGESVMRERLPKETYKKLKSCIQKNEPLDPAIADVVAGAMKDWACEKGATHYTHWFQPMTGITAEKHDSFISPAADGAIIMEFSGKELIKGEPDASSFPSGGLRATFEARGYTTWDPSAYAFIKDKTLYIPSAFYSYGGEVLDKKTPLLRSMDAIDLQARRILKLFGKETLRVLTTAGPEQEYFLIDKELFKKRKDLIFCGRTLFGAKPPKGQELDDHYFGSIRPRVSAFMQELDEELWKLGVLAKTKHNEAAPSQHELAPVFTTTNIATDHNQITMEMMKKLADKHGMACLLHEKPFEGVNGSGKHNNWSLATAEGVNLLEPGDSPQDNAQFLLFLTAVIWAVNEYQDLLRMTVATAGNDHRLGANEAPPAIISMFLGDDLTGILESIADGSVYAPSDAQAIEIGVNVLPKFPKDTTDRNRTSPFAFTGNKFEFRMVGSTASIAGSNFVLNTMVAETLSRFADRLEGAQNFNAELTKLICEVIRENRRIIFNGNNYAQEWVEEAERRGLLNLRTAPEALPLFAQPQNIELFTKHKILTESEVYSRMEILIESYNKAVTIEALTLIDMTRKEILSATLEYSGVLAQMATQKKQLGISCETELSLLQKLVERSGSLQEKVEMLDVAVAEAKSMPDAQQASFAFKDKVLVLMEAMRTDIDELETIMPQRYWPYPTYAELLFSV